MSAHINGVSVFVNMFDDPVQDILDSDKSFQNPVGMAFDDRKLGQSVLSHSRNRKRR